MPDHLRVLYPAIEPYQTGFLDVGDGHNLYWEKSGNPDGTPLVFLHGGPGGLIFPFFRQFFNPDLYNVVLFDQRGCGKSTPFASLENNTTPHLINDIEKLRDHLGIENWSLYGYSWGTTLAAAYAVDHPDRVNGVIIGGVFMGRPQEIIDFVQPDGIAASAYPQAYEDYLAPLQCDERKDPFSSYIKIFHEAGPDDHSRIDECTRQWFIWEMVSMVGEYPPKQKTIADIDEEIRNGYALSTALLETHYLGQNCFIDHDALFAGINTLGHIPCLIIQGEEDTVCPPQTAKDIHAAWPNSTLTMVPNSPHYSRHPLITDAIVTAADTLGRSLSKPDHVPFAAKNLSPL